MPPIENLKNPTSREETTAVYSATVDARRQLFSRAWRSRMRLGSLIELRKGSGRKLFLVHDADGETLVYLSLARRMPDDLAVLAIEPRRIARVPLAHTTIEDMAAFYIKAVREKQPHGPYLLGGLCAGGVIAYEMASQLISAGESVELVALFETAAPWAKERPKRILGQRITRLKKVITGAQGSKPPLLKWFAISIVVSAQKLIGVLRWEISHRTQRWWVRARFCLLRELLRRGLTWPRLLPELTVRQIYESAHQRYTPKQSSVPSVLLVRAQTGEGDDTPYRNIYAAETFGWNRFTPKVALVDVEGGHSSMLQERFVDSLARALLPYLQRNLRTTP
jgi:thioesterase domain-containing protein